MDCVAFHLHNIKLYVSFTKVASGFGKEYFSFEMSMRTPDSDIEAHTRRGVIACTNTANRATISHITHHNKYHVIIIEAVNTRRQCGCYVFSSFCCSAQPCVLAITQLCLLSLPKQPKNIYRRYELRLTFLVEQ